MEKSEIEQLLQKSKAYLKNRENPLPKETLVLINELIVAVYSLNAPKINEAWKKSLQEVAKETRKTTKFLLSQNEPLIDRETFNKLRKSTNNFKSGGL